MKNLIKYQINRTSSLYLLTKSESIAMDNLSKCLSMEKIDELKNIRLLKRKILNCEFSSLSDKDFEKLKKIQEFYSPNFFNDMCLKKIVSDENNFKQKLYSNVIEKVNNTFLKLNEQNIEKLKNQDADEILKIIFLYELLNNDIRAEVENWGIMKYPKKDISFVEEKIFNDIFTEDIYNEITVFINDNIVSVINQIEEVEVKDETIIKEFLGSETIVNERRRVLKK